MMVYMTHPLHGAMHVYTDAEVETNKKNGWEVIEPIKTVKFLEARIAEIPAEIKSLAEQYEEKFGKKPHHRLSEKNIEIALKE